MSLRRSGRSSAGLSRLSAGGGDDGMHSAAAQLCSLLITKAQWSAPKLASRLGVPVIVVEECIRTGRASSLLRAQLVQWIREAGELPPVIPPVVVAAVLHDDPLAATSGFATSSAPGNNSNNGGEEEDFWGLDPATHAHFRRLRQSVGHSFVSVVNDPTEIERTKDWGEWLGAAVFEAFDYSPSVALANGGAGGNGGSGAGASAGDRAAEVLRSMLAQHTVSRTTFDPYIEYIGDVYRENRRLSEQQGKGVFILGAGNSTVQSVDDIPHPANVPMDFFSADFDIRRVLSSIGDDAVVPLMAEQLQQHHDEVEEALVLHVHLRSQQFFSASRVFDELHDDVARTLREIRTTRGDVVRCGEDLVEQFMRIARLHRRRANLKRIGELTAGIGALVREVRSVQRAMSERRFVDAVAHVDAAIAAMDAEGGRAAELRALHHYPMHIAEVRKNLLLVVLSEADAALHFAQWGEGGGGGSVAVASPRVSSSNSSSSGSGGSAEWDTAREILHAAARLGCLGGCLQQYRTAAAEGVWAVARSTIVSTLLSMSAASGGGGDGEMSLSLQAAGGSSPSAEEKATFLRCLRKVKAAQFVEIVSRTLDALGTYIAKAGAHAEALEVSLARGPAPIRLADDPSWRGFGSSLYAAVQACVVAVLDARAEENATMRLHEMESTMRMSFQFIHSAEATLVPAAAQLGGSSVDQPQPAASSSSSSSKKEASPVATSAAGVGSFRALLLSQARAFFKRQHDKQQQKLLMVLSQEQWVAEESVERMFQHYCDQLCSSDDAAVRAARELSVDYVDASGAGGGAAHPGSAAASRQPSETGFERGLRIPNARGDGAGAGPTDFYCVANSLLILLQSLSEYDRYLCAFPFLAGEIVMRIHDAVKLYDGQCAVLVLGAGAVDQGTLPSITVQHLALGSQCMAFLVEFTPLLRKRMIAIVPPKARSFVQHLERVERDLREHRNEFYAKIVAMARERLEQIDCDPAQWVTEGHDFIMKILREAARLVKALKPVMLPSSQKCVMVPVLHYSVTRLRERIAAAPIADPAVASKVWQDLQIFAANVQKFGYSVAQVSTIATIADADAAELLPPATADTDDAIRAVFLPQ